MDKKQFSERNICTTFPALKQAAWDITTQVREKFPFIKSRSIVHGKLHIRAKHKRADYVPFYKPDIPIAIKNLEAAQQTLKAELIVCLGDKA